MVIFLGASKIANNRTYLWCFNPHALKLMHQNLSIFILV